MNSLKNEEKSEKSFEKLKIVVEKRIKRSSKKSA